MLFRMDQVSKTYVGADAPIKALDQVTIEVDSGTFVAIRGPSGCGKSTLLLTAGTLLAPDDGDVVLAGEQPYQMNSDARASFRARQIGFVFQQFHLVPYLSVLDNVMAPTLALAHSQAAVDAGTIRKRAEELLERFGLESRSRHTPGRLSSGERQRCALARALLNGPRLLLADEPTGNLDPENADAVLAAMRDFAKQGGAVLLVTHDERAAEAADRTLWMNQGQLTQFEAVQS